MSSSHPNRTLLKAAESGDSAGIRRELTRVLSSAQSQIERYIRIVARRMCRALRHYYEKEGAETVETVPVDSRSCRGLAPPSCCAVAVALAAAAPGTLAVNLERT